VVPAGAARPWNPSIHGGENQISGFFAMGTPGARAGLNEKAEPVFGSGFDLLVGCTGIEPVT
jgi:hypothetical protein